MTPAFGCTEGFEQFLLTNEIIFLVMAGDTGITDSRHILGAEPKDFAHVVVAHAAFAAPIWNQLTGVLPISVASGR